MLRNTRLLLARVLRLHRRLDRDQRGTAAIEFALLSSLFFLAICTALDFGTLFIERGKLNEAVSGVAVNAFSTASNVDFNSLPGYVRALANEQSLTVTASCNGTTGSCTNLNRSCGCLLTNGHFTPGVCGSACTGANVTSGTTAGYYLTVTATQSFKPIMVPRSLLGGTQVIQHATVRLQ